MKEGSNEGRKEEATQRNAPVEGGGEEVAAVMGEVDVADALAVAEVGEPPTAELGTLEAAAALAELATALPSATSTDRASPRLASCASSTGTAASPCMSPSADA